MTRLRAFLLLSAVTAVLAGVWVRAQPAPTASDSITPDPAIQRQLARAAAASNEAELQVALARLRVIGGNDFRELIPQLVVFLMNATDVRQSMTPGIIIDRLAISPAQLQQALAPYAATHDVRLRQQIGNLLHAPIESGSGPRKP